MDNSIPAFPVETDVTQNYCATSTGMSLRDYFAAKAMQGLMGRNWNDPKTGEVPANLFQIWAKSAYLTADAMLQAKEQGN